MYFWKTYVVVGVLLCLFSCKPIHIPFAVASSEDVYAFSFSNTNIFIVAMESGYAMIDCGYQKDQDKIEKAIQRAGILLEEINYLIITHAHGDHAGNAKYFKDTYGMKIIAGAGDVKQFKAGENGALCPTSMLASLLASFPQKNYPKVNIDYIVQDSLDMEDLYGLGNIYVQGGHTPGSLYYKYGEHVFLGDQLRGKILNPKSPKQHFYMCDHKLNLRHIEEILAHKELQYFHPGHFGILNRADVEGWLDVELRKLNK